MPTFAAQFPPASVFELSSEPLKVQGPKCKFYTSSQNYDSYLRDPKRTLLCGTNLQRPCSPLSRQAEQKGSQIPQPRGVLIWARLRPRLGQLETRAVHGGITQSSPSGSCVLLRSQGGHRVGLSQKMRGEAQLSWKARSWPTEVKKLFFEIRFQKAPHVRSD